MKKQKIYLNGKIIDLAQARLSILDRGLLYGDGVFESLRTYGGQPFLLEEHLKRLLRAARQLRIRPLPPAVRLKSAVLKTIAANKFQETYVKIIITRGPAKGHGLDIKKSTHQPTFIVLAEEQRPLPPKIFQTGWKAMVCSLVRPNLPSSRIKSLNYTNSILAVIEAKKAGADEAILLDEKGNIAEGTVSNIFIVKHGTIYTPPREAPILAGLTRALVIKLAKRSAFRLVEKAITPKELYTADECFATFSGAGVVPITSVWSKKIGSGKCGYITDALIRLYNAETGSGQ